jgi:hypothetical protein
MGRFVKGDTVSLEAAVFRLGGVPLHPLSGLLGDKGPFHLVNKCKDIRISRKPFDVIIADVKMARLLSKVLDEPFRSCGCLLLEQR